MRKVLTSQYIEQGGVIPKGYAVAYRDLRLQTEVAYPLGIHLIIRWSRDLLFWMMRVGYPGYRQRMEHEIFLIGVEEGIKRTTQFNPSYPSELNDLLRFLLDRFK